MNNIIYVIKNKNNFPRIIAEVYASDELLAEYEVNLNDDIAKVDISLIQQYSQALEIFFDEIIIGIKNQGLSINSFTDQIALITLTLQTKTQCDLYIARMDVVE